MMEATTTTGTAPFDTLLAMLPFLVALLLVTAAFAWIWAVRKAASETVKESQPSLLMQQAVADAAAGKAGTTVKKEAPTEGLARKLYDAGLDVPPSTWTLGTAIAAVAGFAIGLLAGGPVPAAILLAVALVLPRFYLSHLQRKQLILLEEQLAQAEMQIAESSRSGLPVEKAIMATVQGSDDPLKSQFERVYNEITYGGSSLTDALSNFAARTSNKDADLLAAVVAVQQESGSSLSAALEFLSETVQKRIEMRQTLRARIAEVKMSAVITGLMPVGLFILLSFGFFGGWPRIAGFWDFYTTNPIGWAFMAGFVVVEFIGAVVLYRMTDLKMD